MDIDFIKGTLATKFKLPKKAAEDFRDIVEALRETSGSHEQDAGYPEWFTKKICDEVTGNGDFYLTCASCELNKCDDTDGYVTVTVADDDPDDGVFPKVLHYVMKQYDVLGSICFSETYGRNKLEANAFWGLAYNVSKDHVYFTSTHTIAMLLPFLPKEARKSYYD